MSEARPLPPIESLPRPEASAFVTGMQLILVMTFGFSVVYFVYTELLGDDFLMKRDSFVETFMNCMFLSCFITAGSSVTTFDGKSVISRAVLTIHCLLSMVVKVFIITTATSKVI